MKPTRAELIDLLHRILPGVVAVPEGYLSESALAELLGVDRRWLRTLRSAGIAAPRGFGRGFLYTPAEARVCAVTRQLKSLGFGVEAIADFLAGPCDREACSNGGRTCSAQDCCERLLDGQARRLSAGIGELRRFQRILAGSSRTGTDDTGSQ